MAELRYTAVFDYLSDEQVQALQEVGSVRFVFEVNGPSREKVVRELAQEYEWRDLGDGDAWRQRLSRGRKAG